MKLNIIEILNAVSGKIISEGEIKEITKICTDSRVADSQCLFIPIIGERFDAHDFLEDVITNKGCKVVLSSKEIDFPFATVILVEDTKKAMGMLGRYYIDKLNPKRIAITGSVGKTTTKDMLGSVLSKIAPTLVTSGNFNNDIGVPLTAFRLEDEKTAVFEMGMNHFGEIDYLSKIVKPDIGVITNIGYSHIENLGSREGILKAKLEIVNGMDKEGVLVLNGDDSLLYSVKDTVPNKIIYYGVKNKESDICPEKIENMGDYTTFSVEGKEYRINVPGEHNVLNALCSIAIGKMLGGSYEEIKEGLADFRAEGIRQNIIKKDNFTVIADCYNAAPDSMRAALQVLKEYPGKRKIVVFGSVLELGSYRDKLLYKLGEDIADCGIDILITVTEDALAINKGAEAKGFATVNIENNEKTLEYLKNIIEDGDVILIKGSRKYKMEEISEGLIK